MRKVILDTNFILTCVKEKLDFFDFFELGGFKVLIPGKVLKELERISLRKKGGIKTRAEFSLKLINSEKFEEVEIDGKYVDSAIINYLKEHPKIYVATIDEKLKRKIKNKLFIIRAGKTIEEI